jgi:hypothetical protein
MNHTSLLLPKPMHAPEARDPLERGYRKCHPHEASVRHLLSD